MKYSAGKKKRTFKALILNAQPGGGGKPRQYFRHRFKSVRFLEEIPALLPKKSWIEEMHENKAALFPNIR